MVRVLAVADEEVPSIGDIAVRLLEPDLVLAAGDLGSDYLEFLASALDVPVVFVPGNHDPVRARSHSALRGFLRGEGPMDDPRPHGCVNADDTVVEAAGLRIAGLGGSIRYNSGVNQYTQAEFARRARRLARVARRRGPIDVLLTHAPPRGLGDGADLPHQGVEAMHDLIDQLQPTWHLHGHIHPYGVDQPDRLVGVTTVRNVIPFKLMEIVSVAGSPADQNSCS